MIYEQEQYSWEKYTQTNDDIDSYYEDESDEWDELDDDDEDYGPTGSWGECQYEEPGYEDTYSTYDEENPCYY